MALNFSGQNLGGRNFKGRQDLAGANFSFNQLPDSPEVDKPGIKELLTQLQEASPR